MKETIAKPARTTQGSSDCWKASLTSKTLPEMLRKS
jgi:hypothetical protein